MNKKTLVFSIALNGYQWLYRNELSSHKRYADVNNYEYQAVTRPYFSLLGVECCWLKLTLMRTALLAGYQQVMFIDADAMVNDNCPALKTLYNNHQHIYMAKGYSNRFNSGVLIARNHPYVIDWLSRVINSSMLSIADKNSVGWGENGHIIELSHNCPFIGEIEQKWNNTYDSQMTDYIHHKNCGPLRTRWIDNFIHKVIFCLSRRILTSTNTFQMSDQLKRFDNKLDYETKRVVSKYPQFNTVKYV